jgi:DNA-binding LacI/PurR family transcriptional regulator
VELALGHQQTRADPALDAVAGAPSFLARAGYCTLILRGIENSLYQSSYLPILTDVHNERSRFERYLEMLLDRRVEALIVLANWLFVDIDVLADLEKSSIPIVMIGRELQTDSVSSVPRPKTFSLRKGSLVEADMRAG